MLYHEIDRFMQETGLAQDPAFDYLHFLIEYIPSQGDQSYLGLYYPAAEHQRYGYIPPSTIVLPPDSTPSTLLHELGHRHGHYYYGDLSEQFAESYRERMEMDLFGAPIARRSGNPKNDIERAMDHYGVSAADYLAHPEWYPLPERGSAAVPFTTGGTTVVLENPPGTPINTTQLEPGQALHVAVRVRSYLGGPPTGPVSVELTIYDSFAPIAAVKTTNLLGNADFDVTIPNVISKATLRVVSTYSIMGQDIVIIPIGIGVAPEPPPVPEPPSNIFTTITKTIQWVAVGAGVVAVLYLASKAAPSIASSYRQVRESVKK